ncbi:Regulatory protein MIG1 [Choanephora cucurbitarum]|uniref:Regulatory protein MIG1 n=1 Tax=Choanephora cucurbitarum TaxID=101091 RepID=A0A1C7NA43_9FUNG|nr:Regulatory protein MIG1 [Choanephora cucurbitarum]
MNYSVTMVPDKQPISYTDSMDLLWSSSCPSMVPMWLDTMPLPYLPNTFPFDPQNDALFYLDWPRHSVADNQSSCSSPLSSPIPSFYEKPKVKTDRPYSCHLCPRAFARKHDLQRHIRVHTGDKPYACPCCKKAFARTDALKRHLRVEEDCRKSQEVQAMKAAGRRRYKNI